MRRWIVHSIYIALFLVAAALPANVSAQGVQDFVINDFAAKYSLTNDDPQGLLNTIETIELSYSGQNRGILRAIPTKYKGTDTNVSVLSVSRNGKPEPYVIYKENDNAVVKIGDADTYITGPHKYVITYEVENVVQFYDTHDELFWDINGDQWLQTFESVSVDVSGGALIDQDVGVKCFTGAVGSTSENCTIKTGANSFAAATTETLSAGETLSVVAAYKKGYFTPPKFWERHKNLIVLSPLFIAQISVGRSLHKKWKRYGKDYKRLGVTAPFFSRPKGLSVMQSAYVEANKLTQKHISAAIIDLSIRGYLKITETKEGRKYRHSISLEKPLNNKLTADERKLITDLVGTSVGGSVNLEDRKYKLADTHKELSEMLDAKALQKGLYELSPKKAAGKVRGEIVAASILMFVSFLLLEYSKGVSIITGVLLMIALAVYATLMTKRSVEGNIVVDHMKGLKLYLSKAEKERIDMQDAVAAPLSLGVGRPKRDVKFFEKLLPFAIAAGVEKSWAKAFADIYSQPPDWYGGQWNSFSTVALVNSIGKTSSAVSTSFSSPSSSSGSGFSGGGAGGGGGGGGGGGW